MNWKDATLRELLETPVFAEPFMWLKIGICASALAATLVFIWLLVEREYHS